MEELRIEFKGLVYVKYLPPNNDNFGPLYYLQTYGDLNNPKEIDYRLDSGKRAGTWEIDYYLEFFCRKFVKVTGDLKKGENIIKIESIEESYNYFF
jgi:hypothetical protein